MRALSRAQPNTAKKSVKSDKDLVHAGKRRFLQRAALDRGLTAMSMFPPAIRRALAIPANNRTGTINDVEHVVILMQENRSFDMYFAPTRACAASATAIRCRRTAASGNNTMAPAWSCRTTWTASRGNAQRAASTHDYMDAQQAWDGGRMYQWPRYKQNQSMGCYEQQEVEFQYALAEAFTLCDAYHCSTHGGTNTNRLFHWTGTNDPLAMSNGPSTRNQWDSMGASSTGWSWKTYPERLQETA